MGFADDVIKKYKKESFADRVIAGEYSFDRPKLPTKPNYKENYFTKRKNAYDIKNKMEDLKFKSTQKPKETKFTPQFNEINLPRKNTPYNKPYEPTFQEKQAMEKKHQDTIKKNLKSKEYKDLKSDLRVAQNQTALAKYQMQEDQIKNEDIGFLDKASDTLLGGGLSLFSQFDDTRRITDEKGERYFLPSKRDLKHQRVQEEFGEGFMGTVGRFINNVGYEGSKIVTSKLLDTIAIGVPVGSTLYYGDIMSNSFKEAKNNGYNDASSATYALSVGTMDYILDKFVGGVTAGATKKGTMKETLKSAFTESGDLSEVLTKTFVNKGLKPKTAFLISKTITEGGQEFLEEYLENFNKLLILEKSSNIKDYTSLLKDKDILNDALYSFAVGATIGGGFGVLNGNSDVNNSLDIFSQELEKTKQDKPKIKQESISKLQEEIKQEKVNLPVIEKVNKPIMEENISNLTKEEMIELDTLENLPFDLDESEIKRIEVLKNKRDGLIKYPELSLNTKYEDIKGKYGKYKDLKDFNPEMLNTAESFVLGYKNTNKRTKEDWLQVAKIIGSNFNSTKSEDLEKYAIQSWHSAKPNIKENLNRQGKKFVKFDIAEWINAMYSGAGVGSTIEKNTIKDIVNTEPKYEYEMTTNDRVNNLNESMNKYFNNTEQTKNLSSAISKLMEDKNYNVVFDDTISSPRGNKVNAQITENNGNTEIKINPNSERPVEFLVMHELTHSIETQEMKDLVMDYASKNANFNEALRDLQNIYGTEDVSDEVLADISGQLFGNQEFINNLSTTQPNIFKRIYDKIIEIANKITGNSNEALFIQDLKQKWENAYRNSNEVQEKKYSMEENQINNFDVDDIKEIKKENYWSSLPNTNMTEFSNEHGKIQIMEQPDGTNSIYTTFVEHDYRNKGLGTKLLEKAINKYGKDNLIGQFSSEQSVKNAYKKGFRTEDNATLEETLKRQQDDSSVMMIYKDNPKYSQDSTKWKDFLEENFKSQGTKTYTKNLKKDLNPNEISQLTKEDVTTTPNLPTIKVETGDGKSKFADNIKNKTNMLSEESKNTILSDEDVKYYKKVTNKESLDKAFERLNKGGSAETMDWLMKDSKSASSVDVAEGWILLKQYQDEIGKTTDLMKKEELNRSMLQVAKKLREMGTKSGQTVQAFNILNRLTPEGMVYYAQSELDEAYNRVIKNKTQEWIDKHKGEFILTPEETEFIMNTMQEIAGMPDGYDKKVKLAEIQKVMTDKLPPEKGAGLKAWMRISMLFNPKTTLVRNPLGNAVVLPFNYVGDVVGSAVDKAVSKKTGVRTTGITDLKAYGKGFEKGVVQSTYEAKKGIDTRNIEGNKFEIGTGKSFNDKTKIGKILNKVDATLSYGLDVGDRGFFQAAYDNSLQNQMKLNGVTEPTVDMMEIALNEAEQRTWADSNKYTSFVLNVRKMMNGGKAYGVGDILIPFAKTPANLTKAIVDYSPVGLINSITKGVNLKRSLNNGQFTPKMQHDFVQTLGKAFAGSLLYILGIGLAKAGLTTGDNDDDKDVSNFMRNTLGKSSFSIVINGKSYSYSWAQPVASALAITANINKKKEEENVLNKILSSINVAGNILLEQSFMESINTVLNNKDGIASGLLEAFLELPSRAIPTLFKQMADLIDPTQRTSFEYGKPLETTKNKVLAKVPFATKKLPESVDTLGRDIQRYGGKNNIFNVFFNPANVNTENISRSAEEIYRLYKETGDKTIMPRVAPYYLNQKGEKITFTSKEKAEFQRISGNIVEKEVGKLLNNSKYKSLSNEEKAEVIKDIVDYSYAKSKKEVANIPMSDRYKKVNGYLDMGGSLDDFYVIEEKTLKAKELEDEIERKTKIGEAISNNDIDDDLKSYLYGKYYSSDKQLEAILKSKINMDEYIKYNSQEFTSDYRNGKVIPNSKRNKEIKYINTLNLTAIQKAILIKMNYHTYKNYDANIINYVNKMNYSKFEKAVLLKKIGFKDYDKYIVNEINSKSLSKEEKEKELKELGFKVVNGRVY